MKELLNSPEKIAVFVAVVIISIPVIIFIITWFFKFVQSKVVDEITEKQKKREAELKAEQKAKEEAEKLLNDQFKELMHGQMDLVKESNEILKQTLKSNDENAERRHKQHAEMMETFKADNEIKNKQHTQMFTALEMHTDQLKHFKEILVDHDQRIMKVEKITGK